MRIIVTGGAGFIGSHIVDAYVKAGHKVAVIDNLSTGFRKNLNPKAKFYKEDILNGPTIEKIIKKECPDVINHHAAFISVVESVKEPALAFEINVAGAANLLKAFGMHGRRGGKFIFASTGGAIYGNPRKLPATEKTSPNPLSPYALSKLLAEEVIKFYAAQDKFSYLILRYSNVFGPRQNPNGEAGVVAIFTEKISRGEQPVIFGNGKKTRDYIYVGDAARANLFGLSRGENETVNISSGAETTDDLVFEAIKNALCSDVNVRYAPFRAGEVRRIKLHYGKAEKLFGWKPKVNFEEGIRETLRFT